jgi:Winged helix DNA-binding domain
VLWSTGLRSGATETEVTDALARGDLVRSWPLRGTLHLVAPEDLRWLLDLTGERVAARYRNNYRDRGLDVPTFERAQEVLTGALQGGRRRVRQELFSELAAAGIDPAGQRGINILGYLAMMQVLVVGPHEGRQPTYALLEEWVRPGDRPERDEALGRLALRYFTSHGPATVRDLAWWSGLTLADARRGLEVALPNLATLEVADERFHLSPAVLDGGAREALPDGDVLLLPGFDEFLLGYSDRSAPLRAEHEQLVVPGKNGMFLATMVLDGAVVGTWRRTLGPKGTVRLAWNTFDGVSPAVLPRFREPAERYARYLGRTLISPEGP